MRTWVLQRLTALYMLLYMIIYSILLLRHSVDNFSSWRALFDPALSNIATLLFFFAMLFHAWIGIRDILIDYVSVSSIRLVLWLVFSLILIALAIWVSMILYSVVVL